MIDRFLFFVNFYIVACQTNLVFSFAGFIVAGGTPSSSLSSVEYFDINDMMWHELPDLPMGRGRYASCAVYVNSRVTVIGGADDSGNFLNDVVFLDWNSMAWIPLPKMKVEIILRFQGFSHIAYLHMYTL